MPRTSHNYFLTIVLPKTSNFVICEVDEMFDLYSVLHYPLFRTSSSTIRPICWLCFSYELARPNGLVNKWF